MPYGYLNRMHCRMRITLCHVEVRCAVNHRKAGASKKLETQKVSADVVQAGERVASLNLAN